MEFMNLEEAEVKSKGKLVLDEINEIEFRNVTFHIHVAIKSLRQC